MLRILIIILFVIWASNEKAMGSQSDLVKTIKNQAIDPDAIDLAPLEGAVTVGYKNSA